MNRIVVLALGWVILLNPLTAFSTQPREPAPAAVFPQPSFQFESAMEGQAVEHDFVVQNTGGADLQIEKIKTG
jgi:hypothetical protein